MSSATEAIKAAATGGANLKPIERLKLKVDAIQKQLDQAIPQTMRKYLTAERVTRLFWQEVRRNPTLGKCEPETIASGLMTACQLGIEIGIQGQGWLIPYKNHKKGIYEAQFIIGYKGMIGLARRSGEVQSIETHIVYANDKFDLRLGINTNIEHSPFLEGDRGPAKLVYGVARFRDGGHHFEWMSLSDVEKVRRRSKATREDSPWNTDYEQMVRKTLIRRMSNYLPMSIEFANALTLEDATAEGKRAALDGEFVEVEEAEEEEASPRLEGKASETVPMNIKKKETVDQSTGEVRAQTAQTRAQPPINEMPGVSPEVLAKRFAAATDVDVLDADSTLLSQIDDGTMRSELTQLYKTKRKELAK